MSVRKPFKLKGRTNYYTVVDGRRFCLDTADPDVAEQKYHALLQQRGAPRESGVRLAKFREDFLEWSLAAQARPTWKANRLALDKLAGVTDGCTLDQLSPRHVDMVVAQEIKAGNKPTSCNNFIRHIKAIFRKAVEWKLLPANPFADVRQVKFQKPLPGRIEQHQWAAFFESIKDPDLLALIKAYMATGRRRAELIAMRWEDVDLQKGEYRIPLDKGKRERVYPINDAFRKVLEGLPHGGDRVFQRWIHPDTISHIVKQALRNAGLGHLHLHNLRHSFGSAFVENGGDVRVLMELLGHSQITTTMIYNQLSAKKLSDESNRISF